MRRDRSGVAEPRRRTSASPLAGGAIQAYERGHGSASPSRTAAAIRRKGLIGRFAWAALTSTRPSETPLLEEAVGAVASGLDAAYVGYREFVPGGATSVRASAGWLPSPRRRAITAVCGGTSQRLHGAGSRTPVTIHDLGREPSSEWNGGLLAEGVVSVMSVVVGDSRRAVGEIVTYHTARRAFSSADVQFAEAIAHILANAVKRGRADARSARMFRSLQTVAAERQQLIAELLTAQERERDRIAAEIHDDAVQVMAAVGMRLHTVRRKYPDDTESLASLEDTISVATGRLRHLLYQMRLPGLDSDGLAAGVRTYLEQLLAETSLAYTLRDEFVGDVPIETRLIVYRIVQEALANVVQHARASHVVVGIRRARGGLSVTIDDDGVGIKPPRRVAGAGYHLGVTMMAERASAVGGRCAVSRRRGGGTRVALWLPLAAGDQK